MTNGIGIALAGAAALLPACVQADEWDVFVANCLEPLANGALSAPADHEVHQSFKNDGDTYSTFRVSKDAATLTVSDGRGQYPQWCRLSVDHKNNDGELANRFLLWSSQEELDGRYEQIEPDGLVLKMQTVAGRSPALQVSMNLKAQNTGVVFMAKELN